MAGRMYPEGKAVKQPIVSGGPEGSGSAIPKGPGEGGLETDTGKTVINLDNFPDLVAEQGAEISGRFTGRIVSVDGKKATISYDELDVEGANMADKELERMKGMGQMGMMGAMSPDEEE